MLIDAQPGTMQSACAVWFNIYEHRHLHPILIVRKHFEDVHTHIEKHTRICNH